MAIRSTQVIVVIALLLGYDLALAAAPCSVSSATPESTWRQWNVISARYRLTDGVTRRTFDQSWELLIANDRQDFSLVIQNSKNFVRGSPLPGQSRRLLIRAQTTLVRTDFPIETGQAVGIHYLISHPANQIALVMEVLDLAFPKGSTSVKAPMSVEIKEQRKALCVETPVGTEQVLPPWKATARVRRLDAGTIEFDVSYSGPSWRRVGTDVNTHSFAGTWRKVDPPPSLPDSIVLDGWALSDSEIEKQLTLPDKLERGVRPLIVKPGVTLGDVRQAASKAQERRQYRKPRW